MENILKTLTTLCTKVDSIGLRVQKLEENAEKSKATSQQHDYKHAELRRSAVGKQPELKGDVGNSLKPITLLMLQVQAHELCKKLHQNIQI